MGSFLEALHVQGNAALVAHEHRLELLLLDGVAVIAVQPPVLPLGIHRRVRRPVVALPGYPCRRLLGGHGDLPGRRMAVGREHLDDKLPQEVEIRLLHS